MDITAVKLKSSDEGYEVCAYYEKKKEGSGMYEPVLHDEMTFSFSEKDSKKAFDKFKELHKMKNSIED